MIEWLLTVFVASLIVGSALEMGSYIRGQEMEQMRTRTE